mmetsp:Transcript_104916/g.321412  ORF Transcript_104916/g.321412 Transcript_104916/m.321412 type:complete len:348 (-) Transcript_104916:257-1300(-)
MVSTSRPRAARSVAMRISAFCFLNLSMIRMRSSCPKSPCSTHAFLDNTSVTFFCTSSVRCFDWTKIKTWPCCSKPSIRWASQSHLLPSSRTSSTCWVTVSAAWPSFPTVIRTGFCKRSRARRSIFGGNVAEKNNVCREGRTFCTMERICASNPMCSIRSASSMTKKVQRRMLQPFILTMSMMRPGVAMTISLPFLISLNCWNLERPPASVVLLSPNSLLNLNVSFSIWTASSRVGHSTKPMGPSSFCSDGWSAQCTNMGIKYATVLPLPVSAMPITSRPSSPAGMDWHWIGVGFTYPCFRMPCMSSCGNPRCAKDTAGLGQFDPVAAMRMSDRTAATSSSDNFSMSG